MSSAEVVTDCWKRIGVEGDSTCAVLAEVFHCRYCNVYTRAATRVLDRPAAREYIEEATRLTAEPKQIAELNPATVFVFRLGNEWLAFSAAVCQEVSPWRGAHTIPSRRDGYILGVVNVRGELLLCISMERVLGIGALDEKSDAAKKLQRLVVIQKDGDRFAFPASEVYGLVRYAAAELQKLPPTVEQAEMHFAQALLPWNDKSVSCLDHELLFYTLNKGLS